jgi:hypothetical protein
MSFGGSPKPKKIEPVKTTDPQAAIAEINKARLRGRGTENVYGSSPMFLSLKKALGQ